MLVTVPWVNAGPAANIRVIPVGGGHTGEPIVTGSPSDLWIFAVGHTPIKNIWFIIVLNDATYSNLVEIDINGVTFVPGDFTEIDSTASDAFKIPPDLPLLDGVGILSGDKYNAGSLRDKLDANGESIWYACEDSGIDEITTSPTTLTVEVDSPGCDDIKALILAVGQYYPTGATGPFNESTPYSGSTLVVPELSTIILALSSFGAFALYTVKRRK